MESHSRKKQEARWTSGNTGRGLKVGVLGEKDTEEEISRSLWRKQKSTTQSKQFARALNNLPGQRAREGEGNKRGFYTDL